MRQQSEKCFQKTGSHDMACGGTGFRVQGIVVYVCMYSLHVYIYIHIHMYTYTHIHIYIYTPYVYIYITLYVYVDR